MALADEILARKQSAEDAQLRQADKSASWANTFNGPQSTEALRATRNLTDLVNGAIEGRMRLEAQTDKTAQNIYQNEVKFREWKNQEPLRDELLRAKLDATGATTRFQQQKEVQAHADTAGFYNHLLSGPKPSEAGYDAHVINGITKFPAFAGTQEGRDLLKTIGQEHDMVKQLENIKNQLPADMQLNTVEAGPNRIIHTTYAKTGAGKTGVKADEAALNTEAKNKYGVSLLDIRNPASTFAGNLDAAGKFVPAMAGTHFQVNVRDKPSDIKTRASVPISRADFERFGGPIGPMDKLAAPISPSATPASISQEDYAKLKPGDSYSWNGKTLTKK